MAKTKLDKEMRPTIKLFKPVNCKLPKVSLELSLPKKDHLREYLQRRAKSAGS